MTGLQLAGSLFCGQLLGTLYRRNRASRGVESFFEIKFSVTCHQRQTSSLVNLCVFGILYIKLWVFRGSLLLKSNLGSEHSNQQTISYKLVFQVNLNFWGVFYIRYGFEGQRACNKLNFESRHSDQHTKNFDQIPDSKKILKCTSY